MTALNLSMDYEANGFKVTYISMEESISDIRGRLANLIFDESYSKVLQNQSLVKSVMEQKSFYIEDYSQVSMSIESLLDTLRRHVELGQNCFFVDNLMFLKGNSYEAIYNES